MLLLAWLSRRWRGPLAGFLFFAGTLFPALGFFNVYPFQYSWVADHFQYLACLGIIVPCAVGLARVSDFTFPKKSWLRSVLGAGLVLILGTLSWQRAWAYQSNETLWTDTLASNPSCWLAYNNLGGALFQKGQVDEAMNQFQRAIVLNSKFDEAYYNLGLALARKGQVDEAMAQFQTALGINPNNANVHNNLGIALARKGRVDEAMAQFQTALDIDPYHADAHSNLGIALSQKGRHGEAMAQFQSAVEINPDDAEVRNNLGSAFLQAGQPDKAIAEFQTALLLKPGCADAQNNLAKAKAMLTQRGR